MHLMQPVEHRRLLTWQHITRIWQTFKGLKLSIFLHQFTNLTKDNQDEEQGGHASRDEEHISDVVSQLLLVVYVGHQYGGYQESDGNAQLQENRI